MGTSQKKQQTIEKKVTISNRNEVDRIKHKSTAKEADGVNQEVVLGLEVESKIKKKKKKKKGKSADDAVELNNNNTLTDSCEHSSVPLISVDCSDVSTDHVDQSRTDVSELSSATSSSRKKRKRKHGDQDFTEATAVPELTKDDPTSKQKKRKRSVDQHCLSATEGAVELSPSTLNKVEKDIIVSKQFQLDKELSMGDQTESPDAEVAASEITSVRKKKKKKKKRKLNSEETHASPFVDESHAAEFVPTSSSDTNLLSSTFQQEERDESFNEQELSTINADIAAIFSTDAEAPVKTKKKKRRKKKSGQIGDEESGGLDLSKTTELSPNTIKKIEMDIMNSSESSATQVAHKDDDIEREVEVGSNSISNKKRKRKKKKKASRQVDDEIGKSIQPSSEVNGNEPDAQGNQEDVEVIWHQLLQVDEGATKSSAKKKRKKKKPKRQSDHVVEDQDIEQIDPILEDQDIEVISEQLNTDGHSPHNVDDFLEDAPPKKKRKKKRHSDSILEDQDIEVISEQLNTDTHSILNVDDSHGDAPPKKKSKKKRRKHKQDQTNPQTGETNNQTLVCELGQLKHHTKKMKMGNVADIDDIFSALE